MTFPDVIPADIIKTAKDIASRHAADTTALEREIAHALWSERQAHGMIAAKIPGLDLQNEEARQENNEAFMRGIEGWARRFKAKRAETEGGA